MPFIPSLRRTALVSFKGSAEVWDLLRHGSLLPPGHQSPSVPNPSRYGPDFQIRSWWSVPRSLSTPKNLLEEFDWAMDDLFSRIPCGIAGEDAAKLGDEMRTVFEDMNSQTNRLYLLKERYDRLIDATRAQLAVFDRIVKGASDV